MVTYFNWNDSLHFKADFNKKGSCSVCIIFQLFIYKASHSSTTLYQPQEVTIQADNSTTNLN